MEEEWIIEILQKIIAGQDKKRERETPQRKREKSSGKKNGRNNRKEIDH